MMGDFNDDTPMAARFQERRAVVRLAPLSSR